MGSHRFCEAVKAQWTSTTSSPVCAMPIPLPSRGYKTVLRFFPNDVPSFEPVVALLTHIDAVQHRQRGPAAEALRLGDGAGLWEAQVGAAGSGFPVGSELYMPSGNVVEAISIWPHAVGPAARA